MVFFFFFLQSKHKLDPKRGKSQSSSDDVVWPSSVCAFLCLLRFFFRLCTYVFRDVFLFAFPFPFVGGGTSSHD